jgi:hypothetical protein
VNLDAVEKLADAVLYEGYILYPYRASSLKNQKRFNFGVLVPAAYSIAEDDAEACVMQTECLIEGGPLTRIEVKVRFLQPVGVGSWSEAIERTVGPVQCPLSSLVETPQLVPFDFPLIHGTVEIEARSLGDSLFRVTVRISNQTPLDSPEPLDRKQILPHSFASTHTILAVETGDFVSLLDPPDHLRDAASACRHIGTWPILAGDEGDRSVMLSSPIILYDYAHIAPESPGDLCDGAEIDEILTLRILTMTDEEKREIRDGDDRGRRILERTESLSEAHLMKLHGVLRQLGPGTGERK